MVLALFSKESLPKSELLPIIWVICLDNQFPLKKSLSFSLFISARKFIILFQMWKSAQLWVRNKLITHTTSWQHVTNMIIVTGTPEELPGWNQGN